MLKTIELNPKLPAKSSIIWLHGLGADGNDFVDIIPQLNLEEELAVRFIFPHAPFRDITLAQGMSMRAWFDIPALTSTEISLDESAIRASQHEIETLIEQEIKRGIPSDHIMLAGFSQGGAMALQTGLRYPKPLAGILVLSGILLLANSLNKEKSSANQQIPILMMHGNFDNVIPIKWAEESYKKLQEQQYQVHWQNYPMQHTLCAEEILEIRQFIIKNSQNM